MSSLLINVKTFSSPALNSGPLMSRITGALHPDASTLICGHLTCLRSLFSNLQSHPTNSASLNTVGPGTKGTGKGQVPFQVGGTIFRSTLVQEDNTNLTLYWESEQLARPSLAKP